MEDSREFRSLGWNEVRGKRRDFWKRESLDPNYSDSESEVVCGELGASELSLDREEEKMPTVQVPWPKSPG